MTREEMITKILNKKGDNAENRAILEGATTPALKLLVADLDKRSVKKKSAKKSAKKSSRRRKGGVTRTLQNRGMSIMRGIQAGRVAVKSGKRTPQDMAGATLREKYEAFCKLYEGVRAKSAGKKASTKKASTKKASTKKASTKKTTKKTTKKSAKKSAKPKTVSAIYKSLRGTKRPYYLAPGYNVGGGPRGAGIVKVIKGTGAVPFVRLSADEQAGVINFLNSKNGKKLRSKGAPRVASLENIRLAMEGKPPVRKPRSAAAGAANWWA